LGKVSGCGGEYVVHEKFPKHEAHERRLSSCRICFMFGLCGKKPLRRVWTHKKTINPLNHNGARGVPRRILHRNMNAFIWKEWCG
jgi:hypothetical protein